MAINVDQVYKTVLLIINKEQRGYLTPNEFNKLATQVQLDIVDTYFETINQQLRVPQNESEYGNRYKSVQEKLDVFKTIGTCAYTAPTTTQTRFLCNSNIFRNSYWNSKLNRNIKQYIISFNKYNSSSSRTEPSGCNC